MQFVIDTTGLSAQETPDGWIWQDIGNYYGAGSAALNWRENQFDLFLQSGDKVDDPVTVTGTMPQLYDYSFLSVARSAARGTGDNAYIYIPARDGKAVVRGTIPVDERRFRISGALIDPAKQFAFTLADLLRAKSRWAVTPQLLWAGADRLSGEKIFYTKYSPKLDSIVFWFLRKSINLYGEALVKTIALSKKGNASTAGGVELVRDFWKDKGVDENELNLYDGSGLSPLNRVTTHAQVTILRYAKSRDWFGAYYDAMPEYNGMKMKSGTINDVKGYCGYQLSKDGNEYIFSFLVNNYSGKSSAVIQKMYKVLDLLK
jgi:D-alanyl-D-alanine carboxypeptidase/D-alanyl-D-alanine-endopeptidase (penicillin-binding protein 4)